jgi:preprotein translocase SecF subunit
MWFRYEWSYAITAIIALIHDVIISVGVLSLFGRHIDMTVVAAALTIIGYSVNDTVVVFDRIRENRGLTPSVDLDEIMNRAINQTLSRTILTSGLTFIALLMLFIFGGKVLNDFAFCLLAGVVIGTYSSIFVASALAFLIKTWIRHFQTGGHHGKAKATSKKKGKAAETKA